jgi:hypothetical protein
MIDKDKEKTWTLKPMKSWSREGERRSHRPGFLQDKKDEWEPGASDSCL